MSSSSLLSGLPRAGLRGGPSAAAANRRIGRGHVPVEDQGWRGCRPGATDDGPADRRLARRAEPDPAAGTGRGARGPADWSNIVAGLQVDRYDFAANLDATVERSLAIQFTDPVYEYQGVFVTPTTTT